MTKRKRRRSKENKLFGDGAITYAGALEVVRRSARATEMIPSVEIQPNLAIAPMTQDKLMSVISIMDAIGKLPGDFRKDEFDKPITYRKLSTEVIDYLERIGVRARGITPLVAGGYGNLFASKGNCLVDDQAVEKFFSHFIHCLLIETQIIITRQYYHGLGFYNHQASIADFLSMLPDEIQEQFSKPDLRKIMVDQLHGKIFLDYSAVMIRAQWDKFVSLSCLVFGLKQNWDSIFDGIKALEQRIEELESLHPACKYYLKVFLDIANERLQEGGWLKNYRDSLLHGVGQHSSGVAPHIRSLFTTSELWDKVCEEHNWLREGIMALLVAFVSKIPTSDAN